MNKVQVYWNSHKKLFSIRYKRKIIGWKTKFALYKPKFVVSKAGRERVLREQRKSVHAWVEGSIDSKDEPKLNYKNYIDIIKKHPTYNPFKNESFVDEYKCPIYGSDSIVFEVINNKPILTTYDFYEQNPIVIPIEFWRECTT